MSNLSTVMNKFTSNHTTLGALNLFKKKKIHDDVITALFRHIKRNLIKQVLEK